MKKLIPVLLLAVIGFLAYQQYGPKRPEFREIRNIQIEEMSNKKIVLTAEAMVYNPNQVAINVSDVDLDLFIDEHQAGKATGTETVVSGPAQSEFAVPITANFHPGEVLKKEGLLGGLAGLFGKNKFEVSYKGTITLKVLFAEFDVKVDAKGQPKR